MFKNISSYIGYSLVAAVLFCITVIFFVRGATFVQAWWLYLGNGLFLCAISAFMLMYNKKRKENAPSTSMLVAGHITSVLGVILSCILSLIVLLLFAPSVFTSTPDTVLEKGPAMGDTGRAQGLVFMIFMNAIVGNIAAGSFAAIVFAYYAKRDQTKDAGTITVKQADKQNH